MCIRDHEWLVGVATGGKDPLQTIELRVENWKSTKGFVMVLYNPFNLEEYPAQYVSRSWLFYASLVKGNQLRKI